LPKKEKNSFATNAQILAKNLHLKFLFVYPWLKNLFQIFCDRIRSWFCSTDKSVYNSPFSFNRNLVKFQRMVVFLHHLAFYQLKIKNWSNILPFTETLAAIGKVTP
jgi:hypothetical protein